MLCYQRPAIHRYACKLYSYSEITSITSYIGIVYWLHHVIYIYIDVKSKISSLILETWCKLADVQIYELESLKQ